MSKDELTSQIIFVLVILLFLYVLLRSSLKIGAGGSGFGRRASGVSFYLGEAAKNQSKEFYSGEARDY
jgi:preprotein translocase subunit SecG